MIDTTAPTGMAVPDQFSFEKPFFSVEKIYLKDASLETPDSTVTFVGADNENQSASLEYSIESAQLPKDTYEVVLNMKVSATNEMRTIFLIEIQQAGIFIFRNANQKRIDRFLNVRCPRVLLPFARELISSLALKAGFSPLLISPLDFVTPYKHKMVAARANQSLGQ